MQSKCPYCDWVGNSQGVKSHVRMAHPDHYSRWQFEHLDDSKGKIKKEYLIPESMQENTWYNRLKRTQTHDDAKKLVLVDGNMQPSKPQENPSSISKPEANQPPTPPAVEKDFQCGNCGHAFNDPVWEKGEPFCPNCEEMLDKEYMYD